MSLIDYPGRVAAVVFTQGCNFRCCYCHNRELVLSSHFRPCIPEEEVIAFLEKRKDLLQGVSVTGGEPTLQTDLPGFCRKIKEMGYAVKLDTNGSRPQILAGMIDEQLVDFIAMDVKSSAGGYADICGVPVDVSAIKQSINLILESGIEYLFRTTVVRSRFSPEVLSGISDLIRDARRYTLQDFVPRDSVLDPVLLDRPGFTREQFESLQRTWSRGIKDFPASSSAGEER